MLRPASPPQEVAPLARALEKQIPAAVKKGDVAMAPVITAELENQIEESADELAHVNELLQQKMAERAELQRQLQAAENSGIIKKRPAALG